VRGEIVAEIGGAGGQAAESQGPFGIELVAHVPAEPGQAASGMRPIRFVGVDGPRWFLRGLFAGAAAADPAAAGPLEAVFREVVVVRGEQPIPPRDLLELRLPPEAAAALEEQAAAQQQAQQDAQQEGNRFATAPNPFDRGPEMTETRLSCGGDDPPAPCSPRWDDPPATPRHGGASAPHNPPTGGRRKWRAPLRPPARWLRLRTCGAVGRASENRTPSHRGWLLRVTRRRRGPPAPARRPAT
jgi:hypothetical protein